ESLLRRHGIRLGNRLVSARNNAPSFIVLLYSCKGSNQDGNPNENLSDCNRDDQQKRPTANTAPTCESSPKSIPYGRPAPKERPRGRKCQWNEQDSRSSILSNRPKNNNSRNESNNTSKDPYPHDTPLSACNFCANYSLETRRTHRCSAYIMSTNTACPLLAL